MKTADQGVTAPLIPLVGDAKTVTSSEFPTFRGTNMECIWGESPPPSPAKARMGGGGLWGFQMTGALIANQN